MFCLSGQSEGEGWGEGEGGGEGEGEGWAEGEGEGSVRCSRSIIPFCPTPLHPRNLYIIRA